MDNRQNSANINWYPGHMAKTKREIKEKLPLVDLVYEVVDARMPSASKIKDLEDVIKNKPKLLIMTKYDLCDEEITNKFIKKYENEGYTVIAVDLISGKNVQKIISVTNEIMQKQNEERRKKGLKSRNIRVLIVGVPNVGKSTLINRLVSKKVSQTGNRPGVTKSLSWIRIHKNIDLLDTPGILWPKLENQDEAHTLAALSSIKEEILNMEDICQYVVSKMIKYYPTQFITRYKLDNIDNDFATLCENIAKVRGCYLKKGEIDYDKVYSIVINDLKEGKLGNITFDRI